MTVVQACSCVSVTEIRVKSGGAKKEHCPTTTVPWYCQTNGAKYQDQKYGPGMRLHNLGGKGSMKTATCTVCGKKKAA